LKCTLWTLIGNAHGVSCPKYFEIFFGRRWAFSISPHRLPLLMKNHKKVLALEDEEMVLVPRKLSRNMWNM
jgi:hypothetical protein